MNQNFSGVCSPDRKPLRKDSWMSCGIFFWSKKNASPFPSCFPPFSLSLLPLYLSLTSLVTVLFSLHYSLFSWVFLMRKIIFFFCLFDWTKGWVPISSYCQFSYPLTQKTFPFRGPKVELLQKERARQAGQAGEATDQQRTHMHARRCRSGRLCFRNINISFFFFSQGEIKILITADALLPNCTK